MAARCVALSALLALAAAQTSAVPSYQRLTILSSANVQPRAGATVLASEVTGTALFMGGVDSTGAAPSPFAVSFAKSGASFSVTSPTQPFVPNAGAARVRMAMTGQPAPADYRTFLIGGVNASTGLQTFDVSAWDGSTGSFFAVRTVLTAGTPTAAFYPRSGAAAAYLSRCDLSVPTSPKGCIIVVGGANDAVGLLSDVWALWITESPARWQRIFAHDPAPADPGRPTPRRDAVGSASTDGSTMYLFGGSTSLGATADMYALAPAGFPDPAYPYELTNVAVGAATAISSALAPYNNNAAVVDGLIPPIGKLALPNNVPRPCAHSDLELTPWLRVTLNSTQNIAAVRVTPRTDCCNDRTASYTMWTSTAAQGLGPGGAPPASAYKFNVPTGMPNVVQSPVLIALPTPVTALNYWFQLNNLGVTRYLTLCEVEILVNIPWVWRRLSGLQNVALNKPASQSSYLNSNSGGDPGKAVDGVATNNYNDIPATCSHTDLQAAGKPVWLQVDLGRDYDVVQIKVWSRLDCCTGRNVDWSIFVGDSIQDYVFDNAFLLDATLDASGVTTINNLATGRFVTVFRPNLDGVDPDNVITVCEMQVFAEALQYQPAPVTNFAYENFRGNLVIYGGITAAGFRTDALRFFNVDSRAWAAPMTPLGTGPGARSSAMLALIDSNTLLIHGGSSASDVQPDAYSLVFPACSLAAELYDNVAAVTCYNGGTACVFTCQPGAVDQNKGSPVVCREDGIVDGLLPACLSTSLPPLPQSATFNLNATTNIVGLTWSPPATSGFYPILGYLVTATPVPVTSTSAAELYESFESGNFPDPSAWHVYATTYNNVTVVSSSFYYFINGRLWLDATQGTDYWTTSGLYENFTDPTYTGLQVIEPANRRSLILYRDWPATIDPYGEWSVETNVRAELMPDSSGATLGLLDMGLYWGRGEAQCFWGIRYTDGDAAGQGGSYTLEFTSLGARTSRIIAALSNDVFLRLEKVKKAPNDRDIGNTNHGVIRAFYKYTSGARWIRVYDTLTYRETIGTYYNPGRCSIVAAVPSQTRGCIDGPGMDWKNIRPFLLAKSWNTQLYAHSVASFGYLRISAGLAVAGQPVTRTLPASAVNASLAGLTPGVGYIVSVQAQTKGGNGARANSLPITVPLAPPAPYSLPTGVREVAFGRPAYASSIYSAGYSANNAVDGQFLPSSNLFHSLVGAQGAGGEWIGIDLGVDFAAVKYIVVKNRVDCCTERLRHFAVYVGQNSLRPKTDNEMVDQALWMNYTTYDMTLYQQNGIPNVPIRTVYFVGQTVPDPTGPAVNGGYAAGFPLPPGGLRLGYPNATSTPTGGTWGSFMTDSGPGRMAVAWVNSATFTTVALGQANDASYARATLPAPGYGRYVYLTNADAQYLHLQEVQVYAANLCPSRPVVSAPGSAAAPVPDAAAGRRCAPTGDQVPTFGTQCAYACVAPDVPVSGSALTTCTGEDWIDPDGTTALLTCGPACPDVPLPANADKTEHVFVDESFSGWAFGDGSWRAERVASLNRILFPLASSWALVDGALLALARVGVPTESALVWTVLKLENLDVNNEVRMSATLSTAGRAGLIVRANDPRNFFRVYLDVPTGVHGVEAVSNGVPRLVMSQTLAVRADTPVVLGVVVSGPTMSVSVNGRLLMVATDRAFAGGAYGVFAQSVTRFTNVRIAKMDSAGCLAATEGETCNVICAAGLTSLGSPLSRTCSGGAWSTPLSTPSVCSLNPPVWAPASPTVTLPENSARNTFMGSPLVAQASSPDFPVNFAVLANYRMPGDVLLPSNFFVIDFCSGQMKVFAGAGKDVIDFEFFNTYKSTVRAYVPGFDAAFTDTNVTVSILNVDEPPLVVSSTVSFSELTPRGAVLGRVSWWDPENDTATLSVTIDGGAGKYALNAATGDFTVAAAPSTSAGFSSMGTGPGAPTNFEVVSPVTLTVKAQQASCVAGARIACLTSANSGTGAVVLRPADANDAPYFGSSTQVLVLSEIASRTNGALAGRPTITDEDVGAFAAPTAYTQVDPARCGYNTTTADRLRWPTNTNPASVPLTFGVNNLFAVNATTGAVTIFQQPTPTATAAFNAVDGTGASYWPPFSYANTLVRNYYYVCINASDGTAWTVGSVVVAIAADLSATSTFTGVTPATMSTAGGQALSLAGTNFPTTPGYTVTATYSNGVVTYTATGCTVTSATLITCLSAPGVGAGFDWELKLNNVPVAIASSITTSYAAPTITTITGNLNMPTTGATVRITGTNFATSALVVGGNPLYVPVLTYGTSPLVTCDFSTLLALDTTTSIQCVSSGQAGGAGLPFTLSVGGQSTAGGTNLFSYAAPTVTGTLVTTASGLLPSRGASYPPSANTCTSFGSANCLIVNGTNLGGTTVLTSQRFHGEQATDASARACVYCTSTALVSGRTDCSGYTAGSGATYYQVNSPALCGTITSFGLVVSLVALSTASPRATATLTCLKPVAAQAHTTIVCNVPSGAGNNYAVQVCVFGQCSALPGSGPLAYDPPNVQTLGGFLKADTAGAVAFTLSGTNFGPLCFGDSTGSCKQVPVAVTYGSVGDTFSRYTATGCSVTVDAAIGTVSCLCAPGVGANLRFALTVGGVPITNAGGIYPPLNGTGSTNTPGSYAAPYIATFAGAGAVAGNTAGKDAVIITGRNFGPADAYTASLLSVSYGLSLATPVLNLTGSRVASSLTFAAANCSVTTAHTVLTCSTAAGAGAALAWDILLAGQRSSTPTTAYAPPVITTIGVFAADYVTPLAFASVDGGNWAKVTGSFFGPTSYSTTGRPLIQSVSYGVFGTEYPVALSDWTLVSQSATGASELKVRLSPGSGTDLIFSIVVADQRSTCTGEFSYAPPAIVSITPSVGVPTFSPPKSPTVVTLAVRNLPLLDARSRVIVSLGSVSPVLIDPAVPTGAAAIAAARNPDGSVNITAVLPPDGGGVLQAVAVLIAPAASAIASVTSVVSAATTLTFADPVVNDVVVTKARFADPNVTTGTAALPLCPFPTGTAGWSCTDVNLYAVKVVGSNFGAPGSPVTRMLERGFTLGDGSTLWSTSSLWLTSWDHSTVSAYTVLSGTASGTLRMTLTSTAWDGSSVPQVVVRPFSQLSPDIGAIAGASAPFPTTGGSAATAVSIVVENLAGARSVLVTVGGAAATLLSGPAGTPVVDATGCTTTCATGTWVTNNRNAVTNSWTLYFVVPAGQGSAQAVRIFTTAVDGTVSGSNAPFSIAYIPPTLSSIVVVRRGVVLPALQPVTPFTKVTVPTDGTAIVRLYGSNLGTAPDVQVGDGYSLIAPSGGLAVCTIVPAPTDHSCYEFTSVPGDGDGSQFINPASGAFVYPLGFQLTFGAGDQDATSVGWTYEAPAATAVSALVAIGPNGTAVTAAGPFPTAGGTTLVVTGDNFGFARVGRSSSVSVDFARLSESPIAWLPCPDALRVLPDGAPLSATYITCTLPEGSGKGLAVRVTVSGQACSATSTPPCAASVFSYDPPVVSNVATLTRGAGDVYSTRPVLAPGYGSERPVVRGSASGGDRLVITGSNFGVAAPFHCAFLTWTNRKVDATRVPTCDDAENYLGEGEVPAGNVIAWTHTSITLSIPPGLGFKDVELSIRGSTTGLRQGSSSIWRFVYDTPVVSTLLLGAYDSVPTVGTAAGPPSFDTEGGEAATIFGANLGAATLNTTFLLSLGGGEVFTPGLPLSLAPSLPTAYVAIVFHKSCVSDSYTIGGARPGASVPTYQPETGAYAQPALSSCGTSVLKHSNGQLVFAAGAGIGANRSAYVVVVDVPSSGGASAVAGSTLLSNAVPFNFRKPLIQSVNPNPVRMTGASQAINVQGAYFGNPDLADAQGWSAAERRVDMNVGGVPSSCTTVRALRAFGSTYIECRLDETVTPAGYRNVSLYVAGQNGRLEVGLGTSLLAVCDNGFYGRVNETCLPCPAQYSASQKGAVCLGYVPSLPDFNSRFVYPQPLPGFYNLNSSDANTLADDGSSQLSACPAGQQNNGRDSCIVACDPPEACLGNNFCAYGYASVHPMWRCGSCAAKFYNRAGQCIKCPDSPAALFIGFILLVVAAAVAGYYLNKKGVNIAVLSIGVDFFQVLAIFSQSRVKWPPVVKDIFHVLSAFNLNIEIVAPECLIPDVSYAQKFFFIMLLPLCFLFLFGLAFAYLALYKACVLGRAKSELFSHRASLISSCLVLLYLLYLYLTRTIFDVFNCGPTTPDDGKTYLLAAFIECGVPGGTQLFLLPFGIAGLAVYTAGYPAFILWTLYKNRELAMEDQLLRAKGVGNDALTNPHALMLRQTYGRSYLQFKPDWVLWIGAILLRKLCISLCAVIFARNSSFQMAGCLLVMFLAYAAQVQLRPYMSPGDFDEVLKSHVESSYTNARHARLRAIVANIETRGRKKAHKNLLNAAGEVDRSAVLGVLTGFFFNYNTVEAIMQFCAVIVCLMGIMYEALNVQTLALGSSSQDSVTTVVLITIIAAIVYFATVVITEMYILATEEGARKRLERAAARNKARDKSMDDGGDKADAHGRHRGGSGARGAPGDDFNVGAVEATANPMFLSTAAGGAGESAGGGVGGGSALNTSAVTEAIMSMSEPPPPELWRVFQSTFRVLSERAGTLADELLEARKAAAGGGAGGRGGVDDDDGGAPARARVGKKAFGQVQVAAAEGGADKIKALKSFRRSGE